MKDAYAPNHLKFPFSTSFLISDLGQNSLYFNRAKPYQEIMQVVQGFPFGDFAPLCGAPKLRRGGQIDQDQEFLACFGLSRTKFFDISGLSSKILELCFISTRQGSGLGVQISGQALRPGPARGPGLAAKIFKSSEPGWTGPRNFGKD